MQTVSQATEIAMYVTGTARGRANQIARALIDAGILPKSSGRNIKKIDAAQMLSLVAAIAMAETVADAPRVAAEFAALPVHGDIEPGNPEIEAEFGRDIDLSHFFATIINKDSKWHSAQIEFAKVATGYMATITGYFGSDDDEYFQMSLPFWRSKSWGHFCKSSFTISSSGVDIMRNLFRRDDIEGASFTLARGENG